MTNKEIDPKDEIELSSKEQLIEIIGNAIAILMLVAFFLKILFF